MFECWCFTGMTTTLFWSTLSFIVIAQAIPMTRSLMKRAHELFKDDILATGRHHFRQKGDVQTFFLAVRAVLMIWRDHCSYFYWMILSVVLIFVLFLFDLCVGSPFLHFSISPFLHFSISSFDRPGQASTREPRPAFSTANKENTYLSTWNPTTNSTAGFLQKLNRPAFPPFNNRCANEASTRRAGRPNRRCPTWRATVSCLIRWGRSASGQYCRTTGLQHCERCENVWRNVKCKGIGGKRRTSLDQESVILRFCALVTWRGSWRWVLNLFYETDVDTSARLIHLEVLIHIIHAWITLGLVHTSKFFSSCFFNTITTAIKYKNLTVCFDFFRCDYR